jgi:hypothetical protein
MFPHKRELLEEQARNKQAELAEKAEKAGKKKDKKKLVEEDPVIVEDKESQVITIAPEVVRKSNFKQEINELMDVCDVIIEVLDARDPQSYRSKELENNVKTKGKKLIVLLNKIDLVDE